MKPSLSSSVLALAAAALIGCTSNADVGSDTGAFADSVGTLDSQSARSVGTVDGSSTAATEAAELRSHLTMLYTDHVFRVGMATQALLEGGPLSSAVIVADQSSQDLADAIASMYGDSVGDQFLALWQPMTDHYLDYAEAIRAGDSAAADAAERRAFAGARDTVKLLNSKNPYVDPKWLGWSLDTLVVDTLLIIDAQHDWESVQYPRYHWTVRKTKLTGYILSTSFDQRHPSVFAGDPDTAGANTRTHFAYLFGEHAYQLSLTTLAELGTGNAYAADKYLDVHNTVDLGYAIGDIYGDQAEKDFLALWRDGIYAFRLYAYYSKVGNTWAKNRALGYIQAWKTNVPAYFERMNPSWFDSEAGEARFGAYVDHLVATVDLQVARNGAWHGRSREAFLAMNEFSDYFVVSLYRQKPNHDGDYWP